MKYGLILFTGVASLVTTYLSLRKSNAVPIKSKSSRKQLSPKSKLTHYDAAGVVFTDGKLILAGYTSKKKRPYISGIGGGKQENETYYQTAIREMIEELFEIQDVSSKLIQDILDIIPPKKEKRLDDYVMLVYTFQDLERLLYYLETISLSTYMYNSFPKTLHELLFTRNYFTKEDTVKPEISHLCLLPVVKHDHKRHFVSLDLIHELPLHL